MKKIIKYIAIIFFTYLVIMVYLGNTNQYFSYSEIDYDKNWFISPIELSYCSEIGTRINCINNLSINLEQNCVLEVFALKDGLPLKEIPLDNNDVRVQEFIKMQEK